jgi:hypothetical protein
MLRNQDTLYRSGPGFHIVARPDNGFDLIGGTNSDAFLSLSASGHFIRARQFNGNLFAMNAHTITRASDGSVFISGLAGFPNPNSFVMNLDSTGNQNWIRTYSTTHRFTGLQIKPDSTLLIAGYDSVAGKIYGLMMHLDQYGRDGCEGVTGMQADTLVWYDSLRYIQQPYAFNTLTATTILHPDSEGVIFNCTTAGVEEQFQSTDIKVYPQPMSESCQIELPEYFENVRAEILDVIGRIADKQQLGNGNKFTVQRKHWPEGLYFCTLYSGEKRLGSVKLMMKD